MSTAPWARPTQENTEAAPWEKPKTPAPPVGELRPDEHPIESRLNTFVNDIKYGPGKNDDRLEAKILRGIGFSGLETGGVGKAGSVMPITAAVQGIPELIHAASEIPQAHNFKSGEKVANDAFEGAFHTLAGVAPVTNPAILPSLLPMALVASGVGTAAGEASKLFGADPETQQLVSNLSMVATPGLKELARPAGKIMQSKAPIIGKGVGYGAAASSLIHGLVDGHRFNPLDLLFASRPVTAGAEAASRGTGSLLNDLGDITPTSSTPGEAEPANNPPNALFSRGNTSLHPNPPGIPEVAGLLPRGSIETPAPTYESPDQTPQLVDAQPIVTRGKGGKMTKSFTAATTTGKTMMNPGPAWRGPGSEPPILVNVPEPVGGSNDLIPTSTPETPNSELDVKSPEGQVLPPAEDEEGLERDGFVQGPKNITPSLVDSTPLTNDSESSIINSKDNTVPQKNIPSGRVSTPEDRLQTRSIQEQNRDQFNNDGQAADELGRKIFYRDNKIDTGKTTQHRYNPGDVESLLPWAETPWGGSGNEAKPSGSFGESGEEYEPPEGSSASLSVKPKQQNFINPFSGKYEPDAKFSADELNDLYRGPVLDTMSKTHGELIDSRMQSYTDPYANGAEPIEDRATERDSSELANDDAQVESAKTFLKNDPGIGGRWIESIEAHNESFDPVDIIDAARKLGWKPESIDDHP